MPTQNCLQRQPENNPTYKGTHMKRIALFLATNFAVIIVISIVLSVLGINSRSGGMGQMLAYAAVVGFTGSIISLLLSKTMAKHSVGAQVITTPRSEVEAWLLQTVQNQAQQWNLKTPEVAIYQSPEPNAFVLAHEMAHVGNGDMVTLTLIQGVVNTFVVFFARIIASMVAQGRNDSESSNNGIYMLVNFVLQILFGFLASFIVMWFSRQREYRADAGAAKLVGAPKMIAALQRLKGHSSDLPQDMTAMGIASEAKDSLLSTHPSLDNRIARLQML